MTQRSARSIPSVDKVLKALQAPAGGVPLPHPVLVALIRRELSAIRQESSVPDWPMVVSRVESRVQAHYRSRIQPVINGTGVLLHTNLGRAPLSARAVQALTEIGLHYSSLELDLESGSRGARASYLETHLAIACQAQAATVVNNCAAALVLILRHFCRPPRDEVILSRGELVQIGGGFRIPEILEASGAQLKEVGTTNKTSLEDYARAIRPQTALLLKVHQSNFFMGGFTGSPDPRELGALARRSRIPFVEDLGSGALTDTRRMGEHELDPEPTPAEILGRGVDLVCFSGDKLLGGPQAGIIAGRSRLVESLKKSALFRALRCDKLVLAALQETIDSHLAGQAGPVTPIAAMAQLTEQDLLPRAQALVANLGPVPGDVRIARGRSEFGGGTLPKSSINSVTVDLRPSTESVMDLAARLRQGTPPVVGYIAGGWFKLDLRTVFPHQDGPLAAAIQQAWRPEDKAVPGRSPC